MTSLRERKKRETARALAAAAYSLAVELGIDDLTTEDITTAAHVSRRTFANYYANKHAAVVEGFMQALGIDHWLLDEPGVREQLPGTFNELIDSTHAFIRAVFTDQSKIKHIQDFAKMVADYPGLEPYVPSVFLEFHHSTTHQHLAEKFGEAKVAMFLGGTVGALSGIIRLILGPLAIPRNTPPLRVGAPPRMPAGERHAPLLTEEDFQQLLAYIDQAFTYIRRGFEEN